MIFSLSVFGCSSLYHSKYDGEYQHSYKSEEGKSTFTFDNYENGKLSRWKAVFKDDELVTLYQNGKRIPNDEIEDYEDLVYNKIEELQPAKKEFSIHLNNFPFDKEEFEKQMEELQENLKNQRNIYDFDNEEFQLEMEKLREEMGNLKQQKIDVYFDKEEFKNQMKELKNKLKDLKIHPPKIDMDTEEFRENMKKMSEELKHQKWASGNFNVHVPDIDIHIPDMPDIPEINIEIPEMDIDIPEIDMSGLEKSMENLDFNMKELNKEMKKLNAFIKDLKSEMVNDGLIKNTSEDVDINISKNEMKVDGKKVEDKLFDKYKKMYKDHFGKDIENEFNLNNR